MFFKSIAISICEPNIALVQNTIFAINRFYLTYQSCVVELSVFKLQKKNGGFVLNYYKDKIDVSCNFFAGFVRIYVIIGVHYNLNF